MKTAHMKNWTKGLAITLALGISGAPSLATAQTVEDGLGEGIGITTGGLEGTTVAITAVFFMALVAGAAIGALTAGGAVSTVAAVDSKQQAQLETYLRENTLEVNEALAMGEGEIVDDLASELGLTRAEHVALGRVLRSERSTLAALANPERLTPERATEFVRHIALSMVADPQLSVALERHAASM